MKPLIVLIGPTAVGKTELSLCIAEQLHGEIISADSRLLYRGMDIGTAKPSPKERVRVPHHLIDVTEPDDTWSLAKFQAAVYETIDEIHARGRVPMLVGGTGQYVRAIVEGWTLPPQPKDGRLRDALTRWGETIGPEELHRRLAAIDPDAATRMDARNLRRSVRALEVIFSTGKLFSVQSARVPPPYQVCMVGLTRPRSHLYQRIDARIQMMLDAGLVGEVEGLLERFSRDLPAFSAIGYRELLPHVLDALPLDDAIVQIKRNTRQFVRRQANWFKVDDPKIRWFDLDKSSAETVIWCVSDFLKNSN